MKIIKDPQVLTSQYLPEKLLFRDELKKKIQDKVKIGIGNILILGDTGTGKTVTVRKAVQEFRDTKLIEINCSTENTFASITKRIIYTIRDVPYFESGKSRGQLAEDLIKVLKTKRQKKIVFLFDEIDKLIEKDRAQQEILTPILENTSVNVILISNKSEALKSLDSRIESRLHPEKLIVERYNAKEIADILLERAKKGLEKGSFDREILANISRYCYQTSGDIRDALSLFSEVSQLAENKQQKLSLELLKEAQENLEEIEFEKMFSSLTLHQALVLGGVASLSSKNSECYTEINELYNFYELETKKHNSKAVGFRQFENLLKKLRFNGYVRNEMRTPKNRKDRLSVVFPLFNVRKFMETYFTSNATNEIASTHTPSEISFDSLIDR